MMYLLYKVIDILIINDYEDKLRTSELQFAFKSEHSTNMCTSIFKEVCSYYTSRNTDVFVCLLDASKAFDRVHYGKLFELLRKRNLPPLISIPHPAQLGHLGLWLVPPALPLLLYPD